jgi:hypothetical protein
MITSESVDDACSEVNGYTEDRMMKEFDAFFKEQPSICDFVTDLTSESTMKIQELALFMSYMVYKAVKKGLVEPVPQVSPETVEAAYKESESWIERINEGAEVSDMPVDTEPYLIQYVISELNQPLEDGSLLEDEQKGEVFFVLKTVISSLTRSPLGKET